MFRCFISMADIRRTWLSVLSVAIGHMVVIAGLSAIPLPSAAKEINNIRSWASPERTRLVFDLSESVRYRYFKLQNPERLVVDIDARLAASLPSISNSNSLLKGIRYGTHEKEDKKYLRVVLDLKAPARPEVFLLSPYKFYNYRLVVDMYGDPLAHPEAPPAPVKVKATPSAPLDNPADRTAFAPSPPLARAGSPSPVTRPQPSVSPPVARTAPSAPSPVTRPQPSVSPPVARIGSPAPSPVTRPQPSVSPPVARTAPSAPSPIKQPEPSVSPPVARTAPSAPPSSAPVPEPKNKAAPSATVSPMHQPPAPAPRSLRRDIIVAVDAGHGGDDPGAIGANGTKEKHVALQVAKRLTKHIDAEKGMRSFLVRGGDYFVKLGNRVKKARDNKADMLISIHADAFKDRSVRGASVFVLSRRKATSKRARMLADRENASDLIGGVNLADKDDVVALVLVDLSQSAALEASIDAARQVVSELGNVGRVHKRRVEAAGFLVLSAPDVPSILVETGYISNPEEEAKLRSPAYQKKLASALFKGIKSFFNVRPPPNTLFAHLKEQREGKSKFLTQN